MSLTILMNAGPWVPVPPDGYGGIENVVATLVGELRRRGVRVVLATVGSSELDVERRVARFASGQFRHLAGPYNRVMGIAHAHMGAVVDEILANEEIDLVHDHLEVVGPSVLSSLGPTRPPVLQTLHWDLRKHPDFYEGFHGRGRVVFNGVSESQLARAPANLRGQTLAAIPLSVTLADHAYEPDKAEHLVVLGRLTRDKGPDVAARLCRQAGLPLVLAGPVGGLSDPHALATQLDDPASPFHSYVDVRYYLDEVRPFEDGELVRWVGTVEGARKQALLGRARAALFPIRWHEPGGTAAIEALACGTPIVAMRLGALGEIVEHGVTGFLADDEREFANYLDRVDEIDPAACRRAAEERFASEAMAERYLALYERVIAGAQAR